MPEPIVTLAAAYEILKLAFNEFVKSGSGETAKKLTGSAFTGAENLRKKVISWFQQENNTKAKNAIVSIQEQGSNEALNKLATYLHDEMLAEPIFARELQELAQNINDMQKIDYEQVQYIYEGGKGNQFKGTVINNSHFGDKIYQNEVDEKSLFSKGIQLLNKKAYQEAASLMNNVIKADPSISDAYYYLAIALLKGRKPSKVDQWTIESIEDNLKVAIRGNNTCCKYYVLWAIVKYGHFVMNCFSENSPNSEQLFNQGIAIQTEQAREIIFHINDPENVYWMRLNEKFKNP
jgi:tetratricopeptide (TPR) repeat protein